MSNRGRNANAIPAAPGAVAVTETPEQHQKRMQALEAEAARDAAQAEKDRLARVEEERSVSEENAEELRSLQADADNADAERDQPAIDAATGVIQESPNLNRVHIENIEVPSPVAQGQAIVETLNVSEDVNMGAGPTFAGQGPAMGQIATGAVGMVDPTRIVPMPVGSGVTVEPKSGLVTKVVGGKDS